MRRSVGSLLIPRFRVRFPARAPTSVQVRQLGDKTPSAAALHTFGWFATATSVPTRHSLAMREMSVTEQPYKAVLAVIADGRTVSEVASQWGVRRQTMHR